jgi:5-methyltetrahydropteroyltriglutamate--homocysteine methyltransferase
MQVSTDRILTTHTGSLPRPKALLDLLKAKDDGKTVDAERFESATADATQEIVRKQIDCGVDVINDGEMSKIGYVTYVKDRLKGFEGAGSFPPMSDFGDFPEFAERFVAEAQGVITLKTPACDGPVDWKDHEATTKDLSRFEAALKGQAPREAFMTAASPGVIALFLENKYYASHEKYLEALADVMKSEYEAVHKAGFILQFDCPDLAVGRHTRFAQNSTAEFAKVVELHIAAINRAVANIPSDRIRLHLCWGNYEGPHHHDVALSDIIEPVLDAKVGAISFEAANPRHEHEWEVFQSTKLPPGMALIPGVIDSCTNYIEHPDLVAQRIVRYAKMVGREKVIAGTDCGFATFAAYTPIVPGIAWAKLQALSEGARIATRQLWA